MHSAHYFYFIPPCVLVSAAMLCPMLKRPTNGGLLVATLEVGSRAIYSCNEGFEMVEGSASRTCEEKEVKEGQKQAVWSGSDPRCGKGGGKNSGKVNLRDYQSDTLMFVGRALVWSITGVVTFAYT